MNCALSLHTAAVQAEQHRHPEAPSDPPCPRALLQFAPACSVPRGDPAQAPPPRSPFQALLPLLRARLSIPVAPESTPGTESAVFFDWRPPTPHSSLSPRSLTGISASTQSHLLASAASFLPAPQHQPSPLTGVGLQKHLRLPQDLLRPVLGAVRPGQKVLKVGIELGLLGLAEFLLCELCGQGSEGGREDCPCPRPLRPSRNPGPKLKKLALSASCSATLIKSRPRPGPQLAPL